MPTDHGTTRVGTPTTEEMIESFADEAEAGYEVQDILRRREARQRERRFLGDAHALSSAEAATKMPCRLNAAGAVTRSIACTSDAGDDGRGSSSGLPRRSSPRAGLFHDGGDERVPGRIADERRPIADEDPETGRRDRLQEVPEGEHHAQGVVTVVPGERGGNGLGGP